MHIGILTLRLSIEGADSLKDKRQVIRSLIQHLRNKFNVSVAEVADLDVWRRATVGVAVVSNDARFANQVLSQVVNHVENDWRVVLDDYGIEIVTASGQATAAGADAGEVDVSDWFGVS
jgi:uncharacterized protein YlxP (DUF503 family)